MQEDEHTQNFLEICGKWSERECTWKRHAADYVLWTWTVRPEFGVQDVHFERKGGRNWAEGEV